MTTTPSSRPRSGRRESNSTSGTSGGRVRKNSTANSANATAGVGSMRPRANTISHVDNATLGMVAAANASAARHVPLQMGQNHHTSTNGFSGLGNYEFRGMSTATGHHGNANLLSKLETQGLSSDIAGGLRTAPAFGGFATDFDMGDMFFGPGTTINPAQLHFNDSQGSLPFEMPQSPYAQGFSGMPLAQAMMDDDGNFEWMNGFDHQISFNNGNEQAIAGSSPSAVSTGSPSGISEVMVDGSNSTPQTSANWQNSVLSQAPVTTPYPMDISGSTLPEILPPGPLSPKTLQEHFGGFDQMYPATPTFTSHNTPGQYFHPPMVTSADTPATSTASISSSNLHSSVTSVSTDSITDATRQALLLSLSQPSAFGHGHRTYSQPTVSSPLTPGSSAGPRNVTTAPLPSTYDLQRYVAAYIQYFHPHLPFLHLASLSFDSPTYNSSIRSSPGHANPSPSSISGGGGCLVLAMAAIGALYEYEIGPSKDLFEMAKRMIQLYLEERRKADVSAALNGSILGSENAVQNTPLWLVQAMLLNVIYGHNCGDKTSADIASTHCVALVSLARAAELHLGQSLRDDTHQRSNGYPFSEDIRMTDESWTNENAHDRSHEYIEWQRWRTAEERKRTLYGVFILSSLLVSAYNHAPAMTNSEIRLDLPCDEDLWAAESPEAWYALGGAASSEATATPFASALSSLLTASQRSPTSQHHMAQSYLSQGSVTGTFDLPETDFKPSTFGCLILINALHNYIWETRQRHLGRQWTSQETEAMHAHIEPALRAWLAAWASNPRHSLERPNPFGAGPLSADCIPLLDLAYVRLFVNLGASKEAFWQRDFDGMSDELARGNEIIQHADHSPRSGPNNGTSSPVVTSTSSNSPVPDGGFVKIEFPVATFAASDSSEQSSKRERHLRKAAFYAANSLALADKLGVTFADFNQRELPMQSAMCAFDCAQVLAEWVSTVQERVGKYLGILGKDEIDFGQVPGIMLLEDEDCKLLEKIDQILKGAEVKMAVSGGNFDPMVSLMSSNGSFDLKDSGYGSKILMITAAMLEKSAIWPGMWLSSHLCKIPADML